mmetsp:Transcript_15717/g.17746  ORF Transcript_15717/g.17746 Transcript_15717/m.17746 type:complete len:216 (-) Transcript_15717:216-863(-)
MTRIRAHLRVEDDGELKRVARSAFIFSTLAFIIYVAISIWRFATVKRYVEALEFSESDGISNFVDGSRSLINANYAILAFGAFLVYACSVFGIKGKSHDMLLLSCTCSGCCVLVSAIGLITVFVAGDLCPDDADDCGYLTTAFRWTVVTSLSTLILYGLATYNSSKLLSSPRFTDEHVDSSGAPSPAFSIDTDLQKRRDDNSTPVADNIPFAEAV